MEIIKAKSQTITRPRAFLLLLISLILAVSNAAFAQGDKGIDVVFILDSSGSMKQNDASRIRVQASKMFINLLGKQDRAAVISFSGQAYRITGLLPLSRRSNESRVMAAVDKISEKGAFTNIYEALDKGGELLKKNRQSGRKQHIILMSDGKMDVGHVETDLRLTEKTLDDIGPRLAKARIKVHTVTFNHSDNIPLMKLAAQDTKGTFSMIENAAQIHEVFDRIFERSKQPDMLPITEDSFIVDKNIQEVTIIASKYKRNSRIMLESPYGDQFTADSRHPSLRWFKAEKFDMITIKNPASGYWLIKFSEARDKAYVITDLKMMAQATSEAMPGSDFVVEAWLEKNGKLLKRSSLLRSGQYLTRVTHPDGSTTDYALIDDGIDGDRAANDGYFTTRLNFHQPGLYKIATIVKGETFDRQKTLFVTIGQPVVEQDPFAVRDAEMPVQAEAEPTTEPLAEPAPVAEEPPVEEKPAEESAPEDIDVENAPEENATEEEPAEEDTQEESKLLPGFLLFMLINIIIAAIVGAVIYIKRLKAKKEGDDTTDEALQNEGNEEPPAEDSETAQEDSEESGTENAAENDEAGEDSDNDEKDEDKT